MRPSERRDVRQELRGGAESVALALHDSMAEVKRVPANDDLITYGVPWKGTVPQRVRIPPGELSLQPVAIGADDGGNDIVRSTSVERVA